MSWTAADRLVFQRLRLALARVLGDHAGAPGQPAKPALEALARCHRAAQKARYPTLEADQLALLRQWNRLIESYLEADLGMEQRLHLGALSTLQGDVALILGPLETSPETAAFAAGEELEPARRPYWSDRD